MIISGNKDFGVAQALHKIYPDAVYCSRATGYDLCSYDGAFRFATESLDHNRIIICAALYKFHQTNLLDEVYRMCVKNKHTPHIITVGSTTDRVKSGKVWRYNAEKKALRDYSNSMSIGGVWSNGPKVSYISFGTMSNNQEKHPDRKCLDIDKAASYIKWIFEQPEDICINEISIDPKQN
jgi:short-subunit dehydrogenase